LLATKAIKRKPRVQDKSWRMAEAPILAAAKQRVCLSSKTSASVQDFGLFHARKD
jgi:hypothetical protein